MATTNVPVTLDTPIVIKVLFRGQTKKIKLPLKDLGAHVLPQQLRSILQVQPDEHVVFERYSDSAGAYVVLDSDKPQIYKTLFRAAKAKLKLRLRATIPDEENEATLVAPIAIAHSHEATSPPPQLTSPASPAIAHSPVPTADAEAVAPLPRSYTARQSFFTDLAKASHNVEFPLRPKPLSLSNACTSWVVYCNNCNEPMADEHFHCGVCDGGDYDLCPACVDTGIHCPGQGHWMVKRFVKNGSVVNSTTERLAPKVKAEDKQEVPGAFSEEKAAPAYTEDATRTCNCCVNVLRESEFVTCKSCDDYDLCMDCHITNNHGHHPGHAFKAAGSAPLSTLAAFLCNTGRNVRHSAVCDGCDKFIYGVRHKCLNCPDWDYCSDCVQNAKHIHPRHRFVPIYEPLAEPLNSGNRHYGIYCDGPLCKDKENLSYIEGIRYKCAVCHDTDFCQNCEAHPTNRHNHTHPLIKFKTAIRSVSVTTFNDDKAGSRLGRLGDRQPPSRSTATETTPVALSTNAATQVQTIVDVKPSAEPQVKKEKIATQDLPVDTVEPVEEKAFVPFPIDDENTLIKTEPVLESHSDSKNEGLDAHFIRDIVLDGSKINTGSQFVQVWTLRNPGPNAWPAGCSVRHVGGDNMLNIDNTRPLSHAELAGASESNVISHEVEAGEEMSFRVVMKAPMREGTAISYWRLKTADGIPFGHRLWCDINVVAAPSPSFQVRAPTTRSSALPIAPAAPASSVNPVPMYERLLQARLDKLKAAAAALRMQQTEPQNLEQIQRVRKAAVERLLEHRRREHEAALATIKHEQPEVEEPAQQIEEEAAECTLEPHASGSGMIFPQLDKESPESSTYQSSTTAEPRSPVSEKSDVARTVTVASDDEFFEDAESVALHSDEDEGFMTDEEYDILDASDEEMP